MKKVIGYIRVSTDRQDNSLEMQRDKIEAYCKLNDMFIVDMIVDSGVSGKTHIGDRDGGSKMMTMLANRQADHVVSNSLDRMFRNASDCLVVTDRWNKDGVNFTFLNIGGSTMDTSTPIGKLMLTMFAAFSELERNMTSERTKNVLRHRKTNMMVYGRTPYGFDAVDGRLEINEKEMHVVKVIYELAGRGKSSRYISSQLNEMGFVGKDGGQWAHTSVIGILKNNIYNVELEYSADEK